MDCQLSSCMNPLFLRKRHIPMPMPPLLHVSSSSHYVTQARSFNAVILPQKFRTGEKPKPRPNAVSVAPQVRLQSSSANYDSRKVRLQTLDGCSMRIAKYLLKYNGEGGEGIGYYREDNTTDYNNNNEMTTSTDTVSVHFDSKTLHLLPMTNSNTRLNGWPFPPFSSLEIVPMNLFGNIDRVSGKVELQLKANFCFRAGFYKAPPLFVDSVFTTEETTTAARTEQGERRLSQDGRCKLVSMVNLKAVDDHYLDSILDLPNECLIVLRTRLLFT